MEQVELPSHTLSKIFVIIYYLLFSDNTEWFIFIQTSSLCIHGQVHFNSYFLLCTDLHSTIKVYINNKYTLLKQIVIYA